MKLDSIDVDAAINDAKRLIEQERDLSPALRSALGVLLLLVSVLLNRTTLNSRNSSKPPSTDPHRIKSTRVKSNKPSGAQPGHVGKTLTKIDDPDIVKIIKVDRRSLPKGDYIETGFETRQVFDIDIVRVVTEYQAQVLEDTQGKRFVAPFPNAVKQAAQYGRKLKAHAVYLSQHQLLPYKRIQQYFEDQLQIPLSEGSIYNFNVAAFEQLAGFDEHCKKQLAKAALAHADETGINISGKRHWLHCASNEAWTHYYPHAKRGTLAMDEIGILPQFQGILCHDHWKPYYRYDFSHALCNAHHLRELVRAWEQEQQAWAQKMAKLLNEINKAVNEAGGILPADRVKHYRQRYRKILHVGQSECPPPVPLLGKAKRGRLKRSKARNLLERLINYEDDVLRFMADMRVPFTNNRGENDIRMTKVQQKISGCFRSELGAQIFCRVRGYLSTCRKQGITASDAMQHVFQGSLPVFQE
jgi:transposase